MRKNGLDATDLEALFAGVARREDDSKRVPLTTLHRPSVLERSLPILGDQADFFGHQREHVIN